MFRKLGRDEVLMAWHMHKDVLVLSAQGGSRARPNRLPGGGGGCSPSSKSSSDPKATAINRIHSNDLEACVMKGCCFWFHSVV